MFHDRIQAGERLAQLLKDRGVEPDIVLAVPRGGLPVGWAVARAFGVPLDIVVARKMGAPGNPELALGAVASDGSVWWNDSLIAQLGVEESYRRRVQEEEARNAREKFDRYRGRRPEPDLEGKRVVVLDDGLATGATITACVRHLYSRGAGEVILAAPVAPPDTVERLKEEVDRVLVAETPGHFMAVGQFYEAFAQVTDEEAMAYLAWEKEE